MTVRRVRAGSVDLAVTELGAADNPPALVLHGFTGAAATMAGLGANLAGRCRVLAPDLVGHGRSDAPEMLADYTAEAMVAQLDAVVASMANGPVDVIGYSMGARAALTLTVARPDRIRRLALIGGTAGIADPLARQARIARDEALATDIERDGIDQFVARWEALPLWASPRNVPDTTRATIRHSRLSQRPVGLANSLRGFGTGVMPSLWPRLPEVAAPTLLIVGELDTKFQGIAGQMLESLPSAALQLVPDAGHDAHVVAPEEVADACLAHLGW